MLCPPYMSCLTDETIFYLLMLSFFVQLIALSFTFRAIFRIYSDRRSENNSENNSEGKSEGKSEDKRTKINKYINPSIYFVINAVLFAIIGLLQSEYNSGRA